MTEPPKLPELAALRATNARHAKELADLGGGLNPVHVMHAQIVAIMEELAPAQREAIELRMEKSLDGMLDAALREARTKKLTGALGDMPPSRLLRPG